MQKEKKSVSEAAPLISVKGNKEGELEIAHYPTKLTCSFCVSLTEEKKSEALYVLYRLRVKESSILFSKTYGLLGHDTAGQPQPSIKDVVTLYAQPAVMTMGKLSTIRVEYVVIPEDEAKGLIERGEVEKEFCRPFFTKEGTKHYEVSCTFFDAAPATSPGTHKPHGSPNGSTSRVHWAAVAGAVAAAVVIGLLVAKRRKS